MSAFISPLLYCLLEEMERIKQTCSSRIFWGSLQTQVVKTKGAGDIKTWRHFGVINDIKYGCENWKGCFLWKKNPLWPNFIVILVKLIPTQKVVCAFKPKISRYSISRLWINQCRDWAVKYFKMYQDWLLTALNVYIPPRPLETCIFTLVSRTCLELRFSFLCWKK